MAVPCSVAPLSTPNYKNPASTVGKASFVKIQVDGGRIGNRKTSEPLITLLLRLLLWILSCRDLWDDAKHHLILPHGRLWGHLRDSFDLCTLVHGCLRASVTFFLVVICSHSETNTLGDYYPERRTWLPSTYFVPLDSMNDDGQSVWTEKEDQCQIISSPSALPGAPRKEQKPPLNWLSWENVGCKPGSLITARGTRGLFGIRCSFPLP